MGDNILFYNENANNRLEGITMTSTFLLNRDELSDTEFTTGAKISEAELSAGQVLLKVDTFAFTANNITYAAMGDAMRYWEFFPAADGKGIVPVWGFADVQASKCEGIEVGERIYGYYPMSTHLVVTPKQVNGASFIDGADHRQPLALVYNQYLRCATDPLYNVKTEALQMLLRPLFTTSFLLDDFFDDNQFFGANTLVLTSASSKTALGMAFLLHHNRGKREQKYEIVGLTSPGNIEFVEGLGCYDRVLGYDQISQIDASKPTATVDFAGNGEVLGQLHSHFNDQLQYSCMVGASHWDQRAGMPAELAGPAPELFFAPSQAAKRIEQWGGQGFQQRLAEVWLTFVTFVGGWMKVEQDAGADAVERVYQTVLAGNFSPETGYILSIAED